MHRSNLALLAALAAIAASSGCAVPRIPGVTPHKIDIQQGNYVTQDMVSQLKPGMTKEQVRIVLGTPLLNDIFHGERWDYLYWHEDPAGRRERRRVTVFFEDGKLARLDGDIVAAKEEEAK